MPHAQTIPDEQAGTAEHDLLAAERSAALREAFLHLPLSCQRLITTLTENPPAPCAQISAKLGIPVAGIGPRDTRSSAGLAGTPGGPVTRSQVIEETT